MLEDQVAFLLQKYLGNYVLGLNKEALKISVWKGDVELTNMQLKPEALNALKLPVKVKAGFLGSVRLKVPWSRLGQEPVLVYLDRIFILAEPATSVEGFTEDVVQEAKKSRIHEMEMKLLESKQQLQSEMNTSWLGSLINTIIGNLKLSITNIHIRYEDLESNPGHPFAAGVTLDKLSAVTVDDNGRETFLTGGALERIQKSVELDRLALYLDSDISPWRVNKAWEDLLPSEWSQVFEFGNKEGKSVNALTNYHSYILQPVTGNAKYSKLRADESNSLGQPLQKAAVNLDDVTLCLSKDGYGDILKLADNFASFNQRLRYAHYRPHVSVKSDPSSWWKYAYKAVCDQMKKASGKLSWEQVLKYASLRRTYISLYASLLKSDVNRMVVDDSKEIEELDRELDIELILQWRMLAHKFVKQSTESDLYLKKQKAKKSWWSLGWTSSPDKDENEPSHFSDEDWKQLNRIIGYKEDDDERELVTQDKDNIFNMFLEVHMTRNASKLVVDQKCLAELSCESLDCSLKLYSEAKVFDLNLGSYRLSSPYGLLAESATITDSLVGVFSYKPFDAEVDWSLVLKASPCYMTYIKESIDQIVKFFESSAAVSQTIALETAAAVQMTIDEVKRTAQQQMTRALQDHARFLLDLDIAAPKITIPTNFCPDDTHATKLLLDLGNFMLRTEEEHDADILEKNDLYLQFNLGLTDISAFLVDGDYTWNQNLETSARTPLCNNSGFLPVIDKCGVVLKLEQIRSAHPSYPSTRLAARLPFLGFHFSPARYHRLMQVAKIFQKEESESTDVLRPWDRADFEGWLSVLVWKGVGNREATWKRRYLCLVGSYLYVLETPGSKTYKQLLSLRGKQVHEVPTESFSNVEHVLAICNAGQFNIKVVEDVNALILLCDSDESKRTWQSRFREAIYRASGSAPIASISETSSDSGDSETELVNENNVMSLLAMETLFIIGVLDELSINFSYNHHSNEGFRMILLSEESQLFELRAVGGEVELSIRGNDLFVGTILKSLEIEDLVSYEGMTQPRYLARSFVKNTEISNLDVTLKNSSSNEATQNEGEDDFFEASENLGDVVDSPVHTPGNRSENFGSEKLIPASRLSIKPPSFNRTAHLLPESELHGTREDMTPADTLDSFVKAQIVIYDHNSTVYNNIDKKISVSLATLSFFCYRPTILAILEFVNAVNLEDVSNNATSAKSSGIMIQQEGRDDSIDDQQSSTIQEPVVKGLLGKGKSRVIFNLTLDMARAHILLMNENGSQLASLSQNSLLVDIKVFPSSFSLKAALGNLKISDDSLPSNHSYFWVCDMRNPGGSSFVELEFISYSVVDEDYKGYDYSLFGQLSEVRVVYLNRFVQEVLNYFMGLVPDDPKGVVKLKDQVTNSEKWFTTSEIEGSPALKLDLSLRKPIILMPRRTDSRDYLELDVVHITVQNTFQWLCGDKNEMGAVHLEMLTVKVEDINLTVGSGGGGPGESIIRDVKGLSIFIRRSLRDLLHQIPNIEAAIKIDELKAALSNKEYEIITECATSNMTETPNDIPSLKKHLVISSHNLVESSVNLPAEVKNETLEKEAWISMTVSVSISLVELSLHSGATRDASLATVQASGAWLLYKSNTLGEGFLSATLKGFTVIDDREGTEQEYRMAISKPERLGYTPVNHVHSGSDQNMSYSNKDVITESDIRPVPTMLILDAKFTQSSTSISLSVQRPQLLVALDFLLAVAEFFVPTVRNMLSNDEDENSPHPIDAIIPDQPTYSQPSEEFSLAPQRPLIIDDERFDHFVYDGKGRNLYLRDRDGACLCSPSTEPIIYIGNGKRLQFKNVCIKNGKYLDSSIVLGPNSSYSTSEDDQVFLEGGSEVSLQIISEGPTSLPSQNTVGDHSTEIIIEIQAIGPELTFYNTSKDVVGSSLLSNKLLHAQLDVFSRLVLKGDSVEINANALGLTVESNGIRILEPFDTSFCFSSALGKMNMHVAVSDIFMNFSFSIMRLFLAVEEDILAFLRMTSKEVTVVCSQFDKVGTIGNPSNDQTYAFWRPRAPPGFAVLGDCLTPTNKPPTKGVLAVNTNFARVKRPISFKLIWSSLASGSTSENQNSDSLIQNSSIPSSEDERSSCSIWFPVAPPGFVAMSCVVSTGEIEPPSSSALCISTSFVTPCALKDCITISLAKLYPTSLAFWRVDNSLGSFLPADPNNMSLTGRAYELRHIQFGWFHRSDKVSKSSDIENVHLSHDQNIQTEGSSARNSGRQVEAVASFRLIWWNQGSSSRKKVSIWRPLVPQGMVYLGDIAVQGYEPPNASIVLRDTGDDTLFKAPVEFIHVGQIKKHRGVENMSFWLPQAPPGFVSLGCIASKSTPKQDDFKSLRCIRSDMVTGDKFPEESIWDTAEAKVTEPFSIWAVGNDVGTFLVRHGSKKPPKRLALKLADANVSSGADVTVVDADIGTFSVAFFDDYGGLMVPLFNVSLSGMRFSLHGRPNYLNSTVSFSLAARSYNDRYDSWEPLIEPVDGFLRYQYCPDAPGAVSQLRVTSTRDLNLNVSVSNANMILQAYASWNDLSQFHESYKKKKVASTTNDGRSVTDIHQRRSYYIIPQNKLGQDIFIRATGIRGLVNIIRMPSGDMKPLKVPVSKNMLDSHLKGRLGRKLRAMATIIIMDGQFRSVKGLSTHKYTLEVRLIPNQSSLNDSLLKQQRARTCGVSSVESLSIGFEAVNWSETFFFKVDSPDDYMLEMVMTDMGKGEPVGFYSAPLKQMASVTSHISNTLNSNDSLTWIELSSATSMNLPEEDAAKIPKGRIRCAILLTHMSEAVNDRVTLSKNKKPGLIQISPTREGPWTTVRLNYAAPAACWRLGDDVVASEVNVDDGNRYVNIRSLVSVSNETGFILDLCLNPKGSRENIKARDDSVMQENENDVETDEIFETEKFNPAIGWVGCSIQPTQNHQEDGSSYEQISEVELPPGWEWIDDWHVDNASVNTADGWVYAPDLQHLKWPASYSQLKFVNYARQRRWTRSRKRVSSRQRQRISVGKLRPGDTVPLPLSGIRSPHVLQLRPWNVSDHGDYSWSSILSRHGLLDESGNPIEISEICVSALFETEELLHCSCTEISGSSSHSVNTHQIWFCLTIKSSVIGKDIHSDPIHDWNIVIKAPLSIANFLPLSAEFSVLQKQGNAGLVSCSQGILQPGKDVKIYNADLRQPLYFSLLPQGGWLPVHEAILLSHPTSVPSKTLSLRSSVSGRMVQVILEQNHDNEQNQVAKVIRVYVPYWFSSARCPPLTYRLVETEKTKKRSFSLSFPSKQSNTMILEEITDEELFEGHTIGSALNFKHWGLSVSISHSGKGRFGPVADLSPLGDMDGSVDLYAYDDDGNCIRLFISSKPCPYSVPTKVISIRPFMTFTNRIGQDIFIKLSSQDEPKTLHAFDSRVSFVHHETGAPYELQVRLEDTEWCIPVQITKEDTLSLVLRKHNGTRKFLRTEIRGYEEGSRFLVVFRLGSTNGPIRLENRTDKSISIRQSGLSDDAWIHLEPLSSSIFSWEDPYGQRLIDAKVHINGCSASFQTLGLTRVDTLSLEEASPAMQLHVVEMGDVIIARFIESHTLEGSQVPSSIGNRGSMAIPGKMQNSTAPLEVIVEFGVVGISVVDHRPRELSYLYLERVFISFSTGYDGGTTSRFKLILGHLQLDNQLPLTLMPVLLAPEQATDMHLPVFKMTVTMSNETAEGTQVYPYVYIRVTEKSWRLSVHEPIIWAMVDLYNNLQMDRIRKNDSVTQVDPEIRVDLVDISEVRLKLALETAPNERPHGVLGVWSPILSAVGNALKIQVHLRKVMKKNRFMRRSSVLPAIVNRIWRDLIHNPLHLIFAVDVLGMTSSTLASLSKGFAELSTDGQFLQLRSKQVTSRRITWVGDGILQGTEALAQGFAFGVSGVVKKPVESVRQNGFIGIAQGLGRALLGVIVQPVSGALDFFSLTVDGIGASCSRCLEVFNNKTILQRIRNPRAIHADGVLREYCEREATGQMILYLAEASRHFGCTDIFKEPSKYALSDYYEDHFIVPYQRIVLVTNRRIMLLQCLSLDKVDKKPCKIIWDVPWEELMALELAKAGYPKPSHLIIHLKNFKRSENFVRLIKCNVEESEGEPQAVQICSVIRKFWRAYQADMRCLVLKVPSSQRHVYFSCEESDGRDSRNQIKPVMRPRELASGSAIIEENRFIKHSINFQKIWSSELELKSRCTLCRKQVSEDGGICSIWRPVCPDGYVSVGDVARIGIHPPHVAALYHNIDGKFALSVGYDLVWRNCAEDYTTPVSIWYPRPPDGFVSIGCVAVCGYTEPQPDAVYCVAESIAEDAVFEEQKIWSAPDSYPWACHIYQVQSEAIQFVALRQPREESDWKPMRVVDNPHTAQISDQ